jgi:oxygen-independent coproporphyrinogen-3 oxidase
VQSYLDLLVREWELYARTPAIHGRPIDFVYFGGGTPSFLSTSQLQGLVDRL